MKKWAILALLLSFCAVASADYISSMNSYKKAWSLYMKRDLDKCENLLKKAKAEDPENEHIYSLLAEVLYLRQDMAGAIDEYKKAVNINPRIRSYSLRLKQIEREFKIEKGLSVEKRGIFRILFSDEVAPFNIAQVMIDLQDAYLAIGEELEYYPKEDLTVIFYPGNEFYKLMSIPIQVAGLFDGKIRLPAPAQAVSPLEFKRVLWHEYTHAIVYELSEGNCPLWLNEGIAQYEESKIKPINTTFFENKLSENSIIPLNDLFGFGANVKIAKVNVALFYQQSYLVTKFIRDAWDIDDLIYTIEESSTKIDMYKVFQKTLKITKPTFNRNCLRYFKDYYKE